MTDINVSFDQPQIVVQFPDTPTQVIYRGNILGTLADQTDLVTALSLRMLKSANLSDVADVATARSNLGLGSIATQNSNNVAITWGSITGMSTPVNPSDVATKWYTDSLLGANDAMVFKGAIDCSTNPNYPAADAGHTYKISVAGKIGGASWTTVEVGDTIYCITDWSAAGTQAAVWANWVLVQNNIDAATLLLKANNLSDLTNVATARSNLWLVIGTDVQAQNANLSAIAWLTSDADKVAYFTGAGTAALADFTSFGRSLVAAANSAAVGVLLWLVIWSTVQAYDANTTILGNTVTGTGAIVRDVSPTLTMPNIGAAVATSVTASWSGGFLIESNSGTDVALFGAWWGSNATFYWGVSLSTFTQGSIVFAWSGGLLSQDNSSFYFDDTNNRVGLLTTAPTHTLTLGSTGTGIAIYNTADQETNYERGVFRRSSNVLMIWHEWGWWSSNRSVRLQATSPTGWSIASLTIRRGGNWPYYIFDMTTALSASLDLTLMRIFSTTTSTTQSANSTTFVSIEPTINQSWTAWFTWLKINPTLTAQGSWLQLLQDWQTWWTSRAVMTASWRLGIGTTTPNYPIQVASNTTGNVNIMSLINTRWGASDAVTLVFGVSSWLSNEAWSIRVTRTNSPNNGDSTFDIRNQKSWSTSSSLFIDTAWLIGIGTTAPTHSITLPSTATWIALYNTADQTTNFERARILWSSNVLNIVVWKWWSASARSIRIWANTSADDLPWATNGTTYMSIGASDMAFYMRNSPSTTTWFSFLSAWSGSTLSSWTLTFTVVSPIIAHSGTAWYAILDLNPTINTEWSWAKNFILCRKASGTTLFWVDSNGVIYFDRTYTAAWTTTTQTINKPSWSVNAAGWATSVTVNNSLVTTSSLIYPVILTNDTTAEIKNVVVSAGSFVINFVAAVTAETKIWRFVVNT